MNKQDQFDARMRDLCKVMNEHIGPMRESFEHLEQAGRDLGAAVNRWLASPEGKRFIAVMGTQRDEKRKRIRRESAILRQQSDGC